MYDLNEFDRAMESQFGLISGFYIHVLHEHSTAAGSKWNLSDPDSMEIIVTKQNAQVMYEYCRAIRSGYSVGLKKGQLKKIKEARAQAHKFLFEEANDSNTPIERKIELVKVCSKNYRDQEP